MKENNNDFSSLRSPDFIKPADNQQASHDSCVLPGSQVANPHPRIAVVVHVFYIEVWNRILDRLLSLNYQGFDIFLTGSEEIIETVKTTVQNFKSISCLSVENKGMDVLPFLTAIKEFELYNYDAVLKLHTKNERFAKRKTQGEIIVTSLVNNSVIEWIKTRQDRAANIFPGLFVRSIKDLMYDNEHYFKRICSVLDIPPQKTNRYFSAGTMFWIEGKRLKIIAEKYQELKKAFEHDTYTQRSGADGTPAHAFERVFGLLAENNFYLSLRIDPENKLYKIVKPNDGELFKKISTADSLQHIHLHTAVSTHASLLEQDEIFDPLKYSHSYQQPPMVETTSSPAAHAILYGSIENSFIYDTFSVPYYKLKYPDVLCSHVSPIAHYISYGRKEKRSCFPDYLNAIEIIDKFSYLLKNRTCDTQELRTTLERQKKDDPLSLEDYLKFHEFSVFVLRCIELESLIIRNLENRDYKNASDLAADYYNLCGNSFALIESSPILTQTQKRP